MADYSNEPWYSDEEIDAALAKKKADAAIVDGNFRRIKGGHVCLKCGALVHSEDYQQARQYLTDTRWLEVHINYHAGELS